MHYLKAGHSFERDQNMSAPAKPPLLPAELQQHVGYSRVFQPGRLTFGFIAPLESYPQTVGPYMTGHAAMARKVDDAGFAAIWLRDVPFYDPQFGDIGQVFDPLAYASFLTAVTRNIAIGTAGLLLPLRDPLIIAKQVATVDQLSGGRFIMGVATGDRPTEYPAFGKNYEDRADRFRDALDLIRTTLGQDWPVHQSKYYGELKGNLDLVPKPAAQKIPAIVIGHAGQSMAWTAQNTDGILSYTADPSRVAGIVGEWRSHSPDIFKPYGYGTMFDLDADPDAPFVPGRILRAGRKALIELFKRQEGDGVSHVGLHFKPQRRPASEVIDELAEYVLPHFPVGPAATLTSSALVDAA
jgi:luciferase-type oxidoreductase